MLKTRKMLVFIIILVMLIAIMPLNFVNAGVTDGNSDGQIIRKTTTKYHTKVQGTLNINGDTTYSKNYSSGDNYIDGNYYDDAIATIISEYRNDMNAISANYNAALAIDEGVSEYWYDVHDEITQLGNSGNTSDVILVGDIDDLDSAYATQGQIVVNTIMDKYQIYTITGSATSTNEETPATKITSANITLNAPKIGDKVEKITKNDGYGDYDAQSINPTVSTTTAGLDVNAFWVTGLEDLSEEPFYGTFEGNTYYYAMIDFEAQEGYELPSTFPDGIKINGIAPDEVFAVYGGKYNHCIAKIKATTTTSKETTNKEENTENEKITTTTYTVLEGANQSVAQGDKLIFRFNIEYTKFQESGKVYIDEELVDSSNYTTKEGSTIITFNNDYTNKLLVEKHTVKVVVADGEVSTDFTITKPSSNPKTGDNIAIWISLMVISMLGIAGTAKFLKKNK